MPWGRERLWYIPNPCYCTWVMYTFTRCYMGFCTPRRTIMDSKKKHACWDQGWEAQIELAKKSPMTQSTKALSTHISIDWFFHYRLNNHIIIISIWRTYLILRALSTLRRHGVVRPRRREPGGVLNKAHDIPIADTRVQVTVLPYTYTSQSLARLIIDTLALARMDQNDQTPKQCQDCCMCHGR